MGPTIHHDRVSDQWIVRLVYIGGGHTSLAACPGRAEAETVAACIAAVMAVGEVSFDETLAGDSILNADGWTVARVAVNDASLEQYHAAKEACGDASRMLRDISE
jgi:hypothetical protein